MRYKKGDRVIVFPTGYVEFYNRNRKAIIVMALTDSDDAPYKYYIDLIDEENQSFWVNSGDIELDKEYYRGENINKIINEEEI